MRVFICVAVLASLVCSTLSATTTVVVGGYCDNFDYEFGRQYACVVKEFTVDGPDYVVGQGRCKHLAGKGPTDVQAVHIENQYVKYLPKKMEGLFVNMVTYRVENSGLQTLGNFNFDRKIRYLVLDNNMIREVPKEIFRDTTDMEYISMNENRIENLDKDLFSNMQKLRFVSFGGNRLRRLSGDLFANNRNLEKIYFSENGMATIGVDLVKDLTKLTAANFDGNICINDAYFNDPSVRDNLGRQFRSFCSGQCDNMITVDNQLQNLLTQNNEIKQQNKMHYNDKKVYCRRQGMMSSSSSSNESNE